MHYHMEIVLPPIEKSEIEKNVSRILDPFDEQNDKRSGNEFFDWYQLGGRFGPYSTAIRKLSEVPMDTAMHTFLLARESTSTFDLEPNFLIHREIWNGVCFNEAKWDGRFLTALEMSRDYFLDRQLSDCIPNEDWWVVTVDYHS